MSEALALKSLEKAIADMREVSATTMRDTNELLSAVHAAETARLWLEEHNRKIRVPPFRIVGGT